MAASHVSADFESGQSAWDAGNMEEALSQWQDAANDGDRRAMLELGRLYRQGLGIVQDYVEAHKWLNLAASRGEVTALEERDALAAQMTPDQIATAQKKAAVWQPGGATQAEAPPPQGTDQPPQQAIRVAQSLLAALGYRPGPADGVWGQSTKTAYQTFLGDAGLPQADTLTPQSLRALQAAAQQQGVVQAGDGTIADGTTQPPARPETNESPPVSPAALHSAAQAGDIEVLKATIAAGVDVNAVDGRGRTALMYAVNNGYLLLVPELLKAQADVNIRAPDGATALFMAVAHGHTEIIEMLMQAGADGSIRGPQGKTPVDVAVTRYGDVNTARENGAPPALLALLAQKLTGEMVSIPAGTFRMGDLSGAGDNDELPVHSVTVLAFKLSKYEVTFDQWDTCVMDGGCNDYSPDDEDWGRGNRPVINVSWDDVQSFIDWLNARTGGNYRLPTEAEWEYAARAGTTTEYSWGDDIGSNRANCDNDDCGDSYDYTAPVGSFPANPWGLHDMHGNVWEWVQDCSNNNYEGAPTDGNAWTSGDCSLRVIRGGSWIPLRGTCVPPTASGTPARTATASSASVWPRTSRTKVL
ncbi:MAG: SUMF1/EgtB/PvdO family nonheme iron enzyme [Gammaproteobacteria bacterium]|nr:SUMF1/EgtB/PvdO family nonheme iron enzyme [Gammaproteobacteria bacterium]MCY4282544.1 SUMF1/EgtB/PvdO family nonheme iron enzyme [Gammaproteobacteria bacterium]